MKRGIQHNGGCVASRVGRDHVYVVIGAQDHDGDGASDEFVLFNPWGAGKEIRVPFDVLDQVIESLFVLGY